MYRQSPNYVTYTDRNLISLRYKSPELPRPHLSPITLFRGLITSILVKLAILDEVLAHRRFDHYYASIETAVCAVQ